MRTAIDYLNLVFGNSPASEQYWSTSMKELLQKKFCGNYLLPRVRSVSFCCACACVCAAGHEVTCRRQELEGSFKSFATTIPPEYGGNAVDGRALLFERVRQMMQIHLQHGGEFLGGSIFQVRTSATRFLNPPAHGVRAQEDKPIDEFHLDTIEIKVKQMNLSQLAQGYCLLYKGMKMNLPMQQKRCFMLSRETFENALNRFGSLASLSLSLSPYSLTAMIIQLLLHCPPLTLLQRDEQQVPAARLRTVAVAAVPADPPGGAAARARRGQRAAREGRRVPLSGPQGPLLL
jgi:hypothetical protein